jgi:hypothetical protein
MIKAFNPIFDSSDGLFWMSFEDFTNLFDSFDVCKVTSWEELRIRGRFIRYNDVSDPDNEVIVSKWIYGLEVPSKTHLVVGLHQEDERIEGCLPRRPNIDFGVVILKRDLDGSTLAHHKDYIISRDCEIECILEPGSYIVAPRSTGCAIKRPSSADPENIRLLDERGNPTEMYISTLIDIFKKFDLVISNSIDFKEFKALFEIIGKKITEIEYNTQIVPKYSSLDSALT